MTNFTTCPTGKISPQNSTSCDKCDETKYYPVIVNNNNNGMTSLSCALKQVCKDDEYEDLNAIGSPVGNRVCKKLIPCDTRYRQTTVPCSTGGSSTAAQCLMRLVKHTTKKIPPHPPG